jgi:hypothetical protein
MVIADISPDICHFGMTEHCWAPKKGIVTDLAKPILVGSLITTPLLSCSQRGMFRNLSHVCADAYIDVGFELCLCLELLY